MTNYITSRFLRVKPLFNVWAPLLVRGNASPVEHQIDIMAEAEKRKPKRPYMLFFMDFKAKTVKEELVAVGGYKGNARKSWDSISKDKKLLYINMYEHNLQVYYDQLYEIFKSVPDLSKLNVHEEKLFRKVLKFQQQKQEKPIKPMTDFLMYMKDHGDKNKVDEIAQSWLNLDSDVKKKYQEIAVKNLSDYKEKLEKWENKMLEQGHYLLVRKKSRDSYLKMNIIQDK